MSKERTMKMKMMMWLLKNNINIHCYTLSFPEEWRIKLTEIEILNNELFKTNKGKKSKDYENLETAGVQDFLVAKLHDVASIKPLEKNSKVSFYEINNWIISLKPFTDEDLKVICKTLICWLSRRYISYPQKCEKGSSENRLCLKNKVLELENSITPEKLTPLIRDMDVNQSNQNSGFIFDVVPRYILNEIMKHFVPFGTESLEFHCVRTNGRVTRAISFPLIDNKGGRYSISLDCTVETLNSAIYDNAYKIVRIEIHTTRWVSNRKNKEGYETFHFQDNNINSFISYKHKLYPISIQRKFVKTKDEGKGYKTIYEWSPNAECCITGNFGSIPDITDVLSNPENYVDLEKSCMVLIPFKNGMYGTNMTTGDGISYADRKQLFEAFDSYMMPLGILEEASPMSTYGLFHLFKLDSEKPSETKSLEEIELSKQKNREHFCNQVITTTGQKHFVFEVYGYPKDKNKVFEDIKKEISEKTQGFSELSIEVKWMWEEVQDKKTFSEIFMDLSVLEEEDEEKDSESKHNKKIRSERERIRKIQKVIPSTTDKEIPDESDIHYAIVILDDYRNKVNAEDKDPKEAIRQGLASVNRLTQFINLDFKGNAKSFPKKITEEEDYQNTKTEKVKQSVTELLRQAGYHFALGKEAVNAMRKAHQKLPIVIGVRNLNGKPKRSEDGKESKIEFPIFTIWDAETGRITARIHNEDLPYPCALLKLAKESFAGTLKPKYHAGEKLTHILDEYCNVDRPVLVVVQVDATTMGNHWQGLLNNKIEKYNYSSDEFMPDDINFDYKRTRDSYDGPAVSPRDYRNKNIRIIRLRYNNIPDYYSIAMKEKNNLEFSDVSGIVRFRSTFWLIGNRPNDLEYKNTLKYSRAEDPEKNFNHVRPVEAFPLLLQKEDDPILWVQFTQVMRELIPGLGRRGSCTELPLPLHFAKQMGEYLYFE